LAADPDAFRAFFFTVAPIAAFLEAPFRDAVTADFLNFFEKAFLPTFFVSFLTARARVAPTFLAAIDELRQDLPF
jgi:hypothetical protein